MGLFDDYFDPHQFEDSGGLLGRLLSLRQQQGHLRLAWIERYFGTIPSHDGKPVLLHPAAQVPNGTQVK